MCDEGLLPPPGIRIVSSLRREYDIRPDDDARVAGPGGRAPHDADEPKAWGLARVGPPDTDQ